MNKKTLHKELKLKRFKFIRIKNKKEILMIKIENIGTIIKLKIYLGLYLIINYVNCTIISLCIRVLKLVFYTSILVLVQWGENNNTLVFPKYTASLLLIFCIANYIYFIC